MNVKRGSLVVLLAVIMCVIALMAFPQYAIADEGALDAPSAVPATESEAVPLMGNDYVWFGKTLDLYGGLVKNDFVGAGESITLSGCQIKGGVRAAGRVVDLVDTEVTENVTIASQDASLAKVQANAIAAACSTFAFDGSCSSMYVFANYAYIDGTVSGDVAVYADRVEIGPNAHIMGTLRVEASRDPVVNQGAQIAQMEFTSNHKDEKFVDAATAFAGAVSAFAIFIAIVGLVSTIVVSLLAEWLFGRHTAAAARLLRERTGAVIGTGIVGAIAAPVAIVLLCVFVVTLPVAGALALALVAMTVVAEGFAGASIFKLAFPRMGRFKVALAGGAIMAVLGVVPVVGGIVHALAFMYLLGYALQAVYLARRGGKGKGGAVGASGAPSPVAE
jgi:cytoskeletal protein CcmA (bactofilin family)